MIAYLPAVNATLNTLAALALLAGYLAVRRRRIGLHRACMLTAVSLSTLFLVAYLVYHARVGSRPYAGTVVPRAFYLAVLLSHTVLATAIVPMVLVTLRRAFRGDRPRHVQLARWTLPLWLYVSATGVLVYWMLYHG